MNTLEIEKILKRNGVTRQCFIGCFPSDKIPRFKSYPHCMVVNTDESNATGTHWLGIFVPSKNDVEYYDSFGDWPPNENLATYLSEFDRVIHNNTQFQSNRSSSCGKHVIYFLFKRCKGNTLQEFVSHLIKCKTAPDTLVSAFIRNILKV